MFKSPVVKIALFAAMVLIAHICATIFGWYETYWWFDIPMHFLGGVAAAISAQFLLDDYADRKLFQSFSKPLNILILIAFATLAAVAWECMEFALDIYTHGPNFQHDLVDTMKDLCMGLIGGGLAAIAITFKRK